MDNHNVELRTAKESDIEMILEMRILFSNELAGKQDEDLEHNLRQNQKQYFSKELNKNCICCFALYDGVVASIAVMVFRSQPGNFKNPSGKWGYIMNVYTLPEYRKRGLSARVLNELMSVAAGYDVHAFELHSTKAGEGLYVNAGFILHQEPTFRKFVLNK